MFSINHLGLLPDRCQSFICPHSKWSRKLMQWFVSPKGGNIYLNRVSLRLGRAGWWWRLPEWDQGSVWVRPSQTHARVAQHPPHPLALIHFAQLTCSSLDTWYWGRGRQVMGVTELLWCRVVFGCLSVSSLVLHCLPAHLWVYCVVYVLAWTLVKQRSSISQYSSGWANTFICHYVILTKHWKWHKCTCGAQPRFAVHLSSL